MCLLTDFHFRYTFYTSTTVREAYRMQAITLKNVYIKTFEGSKECYS